MYPIGYVTGAAFDVHVTDEFRSWLEGLRDTRARARILARIDRLSDGNAGDSAGVGGGVSEMRIHLGPGYRVYFTGQNTKVVILLAGGVKRSQSEDIQRARALARNLPRDINA